MARTISLAAAAVFATAIASVVAVGQRSGAPPAGTQPAAAATGRQVTDVQAVHRAGQTFITWKELDAPTLEAEPLLETVTRTKRELEKRITYRIYRSTRPITALSGLTPVGTSAPLSGWNLDFNGVDAPGQPKSFRYVITDGGPPLPQSFGVYVHNPRDAGPAYYAVTAVIDGRESAQVGEVNRTSAPLAEQVGQGTPVLQRTVKPREFAYVPNPEMRYFTRWEAPPNSNHENQPIDYLVGIPSKVPNPAPVGIHLHGWGGNVNTGYGWWFNADRGAILVASNQVPYDWWTGYHELIGKQPLDSDSDWKKGVVRPYTQTRLFSFVDWLATTRPIDRTRIFAAGDSMGGSGSLMLAIRHPELAWAVSWVGVHRPHMTPTFTQSYQHAYGPQSARVLFQDGTPVWEYFDDATYLRKHPERDIGFLTFSNGKNDNDIGWQQAVDFFRALQEARQPHLFIWGQQGHGQRAAMPAGGDEQAMPLDIRTDRSLPAFTRSSLDDNPGSGAQNDGKSDGQANLYLEWELDSIVDTADRWEVTVRINAKAPVKTGTVDITARRLQTLRSAPGDMFMWSATAGRKVVQQGEVVADQYGLLTVPAVQVQTGPTRLVIERAARQGR